jgi:prepilin-type N-terminal cleavage/methylation domain-containing protein
MNTIRSRKGFTLVEVLIVLAILALLMTAVGTAFEATCRSYSENQDLYENMHMARQALIRMTTDIRTAQGVSQLGVDDADWFSCTLIQAGGSQVRYLYNTPASASYDASLDDDTLYLVTDPFGAPNAYVLCRNVTALTFDRSEVDMNVRNVQISMTVTTPDSGQSQSLNTAAVIRSSLN